MTLVKEQETVGMQAQGRAEGKVKSGMGTDKEEADATWRGYGWE